MTRWMATNFWFSTWRLRVAQAKERKEETHGYQRAAVIAQAFYVMSLALESKR